MRGDEFRHRYTESERSRDQLLKEILAVVVVKAKSICRRYDHRHAQADPEDLAHEVMCELLDGDWERLLPEADVYGYLHHWMRNKLIDTHRRSRPLVDLPPLADDDGASQGRRDLDGLPVAVEFEDQFRSEIVLSIESTCLGKAYASLATEPRGRRGTVRAADVIDYLAVTDEPSSTELAAFFGTTEGAARERKSQVLKRLRAKCLEICGDAGCRG